MNTWITEQDPDRVRTAIDSMKANGLWEHYADGTNGDEHFVLWLRLVDKRLRRMTMNAVSLGDVCDWPSHDTYSEGASPLEAIQSIRAYDDLVDAFFSEQGGIFQ